MTKPTNEQIIAEARERRHLAGYGPGANLGSPPLEHYIIEVVREGWKPPEPVDPDFVAFKEWVRGEYPDAHHVDWDVVAWERSIFSKAFFAGVRYARGATQ